MFEVSSNRDIYRTNFPQVEFAFSLPEKKFVESFGVSKPDVADKIITSCKVMIITSPHHHHIIITSLSPRSSPPVR